MRKLKIGIIDLIHKSVSKTLWARIMHANLASIMPTVIAYWCEQEGHEVRFITFTGLEDISKELPKDVDLVFICAFTQAAQLAYAISNQMRQRNIVTALGGPHARCYPYDASKYFDYVFGFTNRELLQEVLEDCTQHRPLGKYLSGSSQPGDLPGVRDRWKFIEPTLKKAPFIKIVGMLGSMGCPYTCSFCIDSDVAYQTMDFDVIKDDLRFLLTKFKRPKVAWHDPNFGVRFDEILQVIEDAIPPNSIDFIAESSMSFLSEPHLQRLKSNGFKALLPGIESWFELGNKTRSGRNQGGEKMHKVSQHVNLIMDYIPYLQANFVFGLDSDEGPETFELTKKFIDLSPAAFPGFSLLTSFGRAAPLNFQYYQEGRLLPFPFHTLNNHMAMNVRPKNYSWPQFYDYLIDVTEYSFSERAMRRRFSHSTTYVTRWMNFIRAVSNEGWGRIRLFKQIRKLLDTDRQFREYFEGETTKLPAFYHDLIRKDLGPLWKCLPEGALKHDLSADLREKVPV
ncbi:MAG: radical SAM protein [Saprospiraceae bacterium]|nr:radical SAM protein [Saprospiraceae bacterium]